MTKTRRGSKPAAQAAAPLPQKAPPPVPLQKRDFRKWMRDFRNRIGETWVGQFLSHCRGWLRDRREWLGEKLFGKYLSLSKTGWAVLVVLSLGLAAGTYALLQHATQQRLFDVARTTNLIGAFCSSVPSLDQDSCVQGVPRKDGLQFSDELIWNILIDAGVIASEQVATPEDLAKATSSDAALKNTVYALSRPQRIGESGPQFLIAISRGVCNNSGTGGPSDAKDGNESAANAYANAVAYLIARLYPSSAADAKSLLDKAFMDAAASGKFDFTLLRMSVPNSITDAEIANAMLLKAKASSGHGYHYADKKQCFSRPKGIGSADIENDDLWRSFDQMEKLLLWGIGQLRTTPKYRSAVFFVTLVTGWEQFFIFLVGYFAFVLCIVRLWTAVIMMYISKRMIEGGGQVRPSRDNVVALLSRTSTEVRTLDPAQRAYWKDQLMDQVASARWPMRWAIAILPALGFIGTVRGIMNSLSGADAIVWASTSSERAQAISTLSADLGLAFSTTLLALAIGILLSLLSALENRCFEQSILPLFGHHAFESNPEPTPAATAP